MVRLSATDLLIIVLYAGLMLAIGVWRGRKGSLETYFANNRATGLTLMLFSTVATWVGAGAVVGVCSASFNSGISFALSVIIINTVFMTLFGVISPRLKAFGDTWQAYTPGVLLEHFFDSRVRVLFAVVSMLTALVWGAVQLLAMGQFLSLILQLDLWISLFAALALVLVYTTFGGLRSDIYTDALQFVVMVITFAVFIPVVVSDSGGFSVLSKLPPGHFDPAGFGGWTFLLASLVIGCLYPLVNVWEWQRVFAARSGNIARWSYLLSIPFCILFVGAACLAGLYAAVQMPAARPDQVLFSMLQVSLPAGVLGLAYAGVLALIMSSIDSIFIAITAVFTNDLLPAVRSSSGSPRLRRVRWVNFFAGSLCGALALCFPSIVNLSLVATYLSFCFAAVMLSILLNWSVSARAARCSVLSGLLVLALGWTFLGKNCFPLIVVAIFAPLIFQKKQLRCAGKSAG